MFFRLSWDFKGNINNHINKSYCYIFARRPNGIILIQTAFNEKKLIWWLSQRHPTYKNFGVLYYTFASSYISSKTMAAIFFRARDYDNILVKV